RIGELRRLLESERAGDLEGDLGRVYAVVAAEEALRLEVDHREAGDHAALRRLLDSLVDGGDELAGDDAADDRVDEVVPLTPSARAEPDVAVADLSAAAALLLVPAVSFGSRADSLPVRDPRLAHRHPDVVLPLHRLAPPTAARPAATTRDRLPQLRDEVGLEAGILLVEHVQGVRELVLVATVLDLESEGDVRRREVDAAHHERVAGS